MYYAFGWAQMNSHADLILKLYAQARGRASEYFGKDYIESDRQILLFDLPALPERIICSRIRSINLTWMLLLKG